MYHENMKAKYRVTYMEFERGWGSRVDGHDDFDTFEEAQKCIDDFNAHNTAPTVPDWYMVAMGPDLVDLDRK